MMESQPQPQDKPQPKKSPKEVIEENSSAHQEDAFIKYPGKQTTELSSDNADHDEVNLSKESHKKLVESKNRYNLIHTHPSKLDPEIINKQLSGEDKIRLKSYGISDSILLENAEKMVGLHSANDLQSFLIINSMKFATIAVRNPDTGELLGYNVLAKTKTTPIIVPELDTHLCKGLWQLLKLSVGVGKFSRDLKSYSGAQGDANSSLRPEIGRGGYDEFLKKYHLKSRLVPASGYEVNETQSSFKKKDSK